MLLNFSALVLMFEFLVDQNDWQNEFNLHSRVGVPDQSEKYLIKNN